MKLLICVVCAAACLGQSSPPKARSASSMVAIRPGGSYLGVAVVEIDADRAKALKMREERGVEVKVVDENSPAFKAGLKADDVVVEFNGQRVEGTAQFIRMVSETPPGRKAVLGILRAGSPVSLTAVLEPRNAAQIAMNQFPLEGLQFNLPPVPPTVMMPDLPRAQMLWRTGVLGIETEALNSQMAEYFGVKQGVLVRMVNRDSAGERAGLKAGDVIVKADGKPVAVTREISSLLKDRKSIALGIVRNHKPLSLDVSLDRDER